jgi:hypothetical protein
MQKETIKNVILDCDPRLEIYEMPLQVRGVYILFDRSGIQYVGQSLNVYKRVGDHVGKIRFSGAYYIPCKKTLLGTLEARLIRALRPLQNKQMNPSYERPRADADETGKMIEMALKVLARENKLDVTPERIV